MSTSLRLASGLPGAGINVGRIAQMRKKIEEKQKFGCMEKLSEAIQTSVEKLIGVVPGVTAEDDKTSATIKANIALSSPKGMDIAKALLGKDADEAAIRLVLRDMQSIGTEGIDPDNLTPETKVAIATFANYTKQDYEFVTAFIRGKRYDKSLGEDRDAREDEIRKGEELLNGLKEAWPHMPKYPGDTVYRVVHSGTGEDAISAGSSWTKGNPTSSSVSIDYSRLGDGKTGCVIRITNPSSPCAPVDTRAVSFYVHEGEILLPPGAVFRKVAEANGNSPAEFDVTVPTSF